MDFVASTTIIGNEANYVKQLYNQIHRTAYHKPKQRWQFEIVLLGEVLVKRFYIDVA